MTGLKFPDALRRQARAVANIVFPASCPGCGADTAATGGLCAGCWAETRFLETPSCPCCGRPVTPGSDLAGAELCDHCLAAPPPWDRGAAAVAYSGAARRMILGLKHGDRLDSVPVFGHWLLRRAPRLIAEAERIVPVPLHWTRRLKRRCNQSAELARWIARASGTRFDPGLLRRVRATGSQRGRDRTARAENLAGAIAAADGVRGRRILLVDDVMTTGSTLAACTEACREKGAVAVDVLVIALVTGRDTPYVAPHPEEDDA